MEASNLGCDYMKAVFHRLEMVDAGIIEDSHKMCGFLSAYALPDCDGGESLVLTLSDVLPCLGHQL